MPRGNRPRDTVIGVDVINAPAPVAPSTSRWGLLHALVGVAIFVACIFAPSLLPAEWMSYPVWLAVRFTMPLFVIGWIVFASRRWGTGRLVADYGLSFKWIDLLAIPAAFAVIWVGEPIIAGIALVMFGDPGGFDTNVFTSPEAMIWVPDLILAVLIAPFTEEIVFRGMLQPSLKRWFDGNAPDQDRSFRATNAAVLITAALFCSLHLPQILGGVNGVSLAAVTFFSGIVLGALAMATRRTAPSIAVHSATNLLATATAYGLVT